MKLRELIAKATPGPWNTEGESNDDVSIVNRAYMGDDWDIATVHGSPANAALIARCNPATMLAVMEIVERASLDARSMVDVMRVLGESNELREAEDKLENIQRVLRLLNSQP